jgi:hypothetical protein
MLQNPQEQGATENPYFARLAHAAPSEQLEHLIAPTISRAIAVIADLGIPDLLAAGPATCLQLAETTRTDPSPLYRLLRALASVGLFTEVEPRTFALTEIGALLRSDHPTSFLPYLMDVNSPEKVQAYNALRHSVETGEAAFTHVHGMDVWDYRITHPESNDRFNAFQAARTGHLVNAVVSSYDFSGYGTIVDVGGSVGVWLIGILQANPTMQGILFDLPHVVAGARPRLEAAGVADRCTVVGGSMFEAVPKGADAYFLSRVLHDWDDDHASAALASCRQSIGPQGRLLVVEEVVPPGDTPAFVKLTDIGMMVLTGGRERTEVEYRALFAGAGFELVRVLTTRSRMNIIEGVPA